MAFYDHRLPIDIERMAVGGPGFRTNVVAALSGFEQRNIDWSKIRGSWDLAGRFMRFEETTPAVTTDLQTVRDLFVVQQGRAHGFRFMDYLDFEIGDYSDPTNDNQSIGTGDAAETVFQIFKRYTFGAINYDRDIKKPTLTSGRVIVLLDDVVKATPADYSVDLNTGIITWVVAPGGGVDVQVAMEYDFPVRFAEDSIGITLEPASIGEISSIPIVELRL